MKRFLSTVVFCVFLLVFGLIILLPKASAEKNLLQNLLNLPAAAPPNPDSKISRRSVSNVYERDTPPDDNAPIEDLMEFWFRQNYAYQEAGYNIKPSAQALSRILSELRDKPEKLPNYLNVLPETEEIQSFVKQAYDRQSAAIENEDEEEGEGHDGRLKDWLTYHSPYFSDELLKAVEKVGDTNEYVTNQKELLALARVDWDKAKPILERLLNDNNQPVSQTLARWAFYQHALKEQNSSDIETYRKLLKSTVENKTAKPGNRDLAMDALVEGGEFEGRDDWYYTLLEDESLHNLRVNGATYTGLTTLLNRSPKGKYTAKMLELVNSQNPLIRRAAVRNLATMVNSKNPEVIKALLPWLENPDWAQETNGERRSIVYALSQIQLPESVPGLIAVLNEKQTINAMNSMSNSAYAANSIGAAANRIGNMTNSMGNTVNADYYPFRMEAVSALAAQKDSRAIMPLRDVLSQMENWQANNVVRALLASGGFTIPEQVEAVETVARLSGAMPDESMGNSADVVANTASSEKAVAMVTTVNSNMAAFNADYYNRKFNSSDIKPLLGQQLTQQLEPEEILVASLIERLKVLEQKEPLTAYGLRRIMLNWRGTLINQMLMRDVRDNKADLDVVVKLLSQRKELREKQWNDINDMRTGSQTAVGIAACLMENSTEFDSLLQHGSSESKTAMLACARLIRTALPVPKVAENLKNPDKLLALAAERYLEAEDSPTAQNLVLAMHPNEAKILGAKKVFKPDNATASSQYLSLLFASLENSSGLQSYYYEDYEDEIAAGEKKLQKEVKENQELLGVYAYDDNFIRIYKDKAVFSWQSDKARFRERELSKEEFEAFKDYVASERVNELAPFFYGCEVTCEEKEFLMLGRNGGRRIYMMGDEKPRFFAQLASIFERMRQSPARLRYALEKNYSGLEILFEDENLSAETVWKNAADFRVLVSDAARRKQIEKELRRQSRADETGEEIDYDNLWKIRRKRTAQREFENFAWYRVADGKLGGLADQPSEIKFIKPFDGMDVLPEKGVWKTKTAAFEIRADSEGLYKIAGGRLTKIGEGYYESPIVTPNGKWAIVNKFGEDSPQVVRFNLTTRKEIPVKIEAEYYPRLIPLAFVPSINKVLIFKGEYSESEHDAEESLEEILDQPNAEYYLLDPETGAVSKAKNEIRPLAQQTFRPLQTTGKPDEFWAAIPDSEKEQTEVGVYNAKTLTFKPLLKLPEIEFNSMQMWVDADKIYFVYQGHLLGLPLPK